MLTWLRLKSRHVEIRTNNDGHWITTGMQRGWARCQRCRSLEEHPQAAPDGRALCVDCYYFHTMKADAFWARDEDYLFPYNIGQRVQAVAFVELEAIQKAKDWRVTLLGFLGRGKRLGLEWSRGGA